MGTPTVFTPHFNLILPVVGASAVDWATWTNLNWGAVDTALQDLTDGKLGTNPVDNVLYGRRNNEWLAINVSGVNVTVGIGEAPNDGNYYFRRNLNWVDSASVIDVAVETAIASCPIRLFRSVSPLVIGVGGDYVFDQAVDHSVFNGNDVRFRVSGTYTASSNTGRLVNIDFRFGATVLFSSDFLVDAVPSGETVPFVVEGVLSSLSTTSQRVTGTVVVGTHDPTASPPEAPTSLFAAFGGTSAQNTSGVGSKNVAMIVACLDAGTGAQIDIAHVSLFKE